MASPFHVFRKHQKLMIAALCLLAMIAFVFLPMLAQHQQNMRIAKDPVVVTTTKYGDLRESGLHDLRLRRQRLHHFLEQALIEARTANELSLQFVKAFADDLGEEATVESWLFTKRAEEHGMRVDDAMISRLLFEWTDNQLSGEDFARLRQRLSMSEAEVFDSFGSALLAWNLRQMVRVGASVPTPAERWAYYQRLHRKVSAEVAPVAVADFLKDVPEPTEAELEEFFEKHKGEYAVPGSPDPGFRVPKRVAIQYVKADYETFASAQSVTDEEIQKYYEEHKHDFPNITLPGLDLNAPADAAKKPEPPSDAKTPDAPTDAAKKPEPPSDAKKPDAPADAAKKPEPTDGSGGPWATDILLVSMQEEPATETSVPPPAAKPAESSAPPKEPALPGPEEKQPESKSQPKTEPQPAEPAKPGPTIQLPGDAPSPPGESAAEPPAAETAPPAAATPPGAAPPAAAPPAKPPYKPLEEVRDDIRRTLAGQKARERILAALGPIESKMKEFRTARTRYEADVEEGTAGTAPTIDLGALAKAAGMTFHETGLASQQQIEQTDIGKSFLLAFTQDQPTGRQGRPFVAAAFEGLPVYQPRISQDDVGRGGEGSYYLFWKTAAADDRVPEFADEGVREEVLAAWKTRQARDLALRRAEQLAAEARKSGQPLADSIGKQPKVEVFRTGPFTWMTTGTVPLGLPRTRPWLSSVTHVEGAGRDFMRAVYDLPVGGVGVAMNQPRSIAYVIRLTESTPDEKVLWEGFKADDFGTYAAVADDDVREALWAWDKQLQRDSGLQWKRQPQRPEPRSR